MGTVRVPFGRVAPPRAEAVQWGVPVSGATMQALAQGAAHLAGWRARRVVAHIRNVAVAAPAADKAATLQVRLSLSDRATHLLVAVEYGSQSVGVPTVVLRLRNLAGVEQDSIQFSRGTGTLPDVLPEDYLIQALTAWERGGWAATPPTVSPDTSLLRTPSPLIVPAGIRGLDALLEVAPVSASVFSVLAWELPTLTVESAP